MTFQKHFEVLILTNLPKHALEAQKVWVDSTHLEWKFWGVWNLLQGTWQAAAKASLQVLGTWRLWFQRKSLFQKAFEECEGVVEEFSTHRWLICSWKGRFLTAGYLYWSIYIKMHSSFKIQFNHGVPEHWIMDLGSQQILGQILLLAHLCHFQRHSPDYKIKRY